MIKSLSVFLMILVIAGCRGNKKPDSVHNWDPGKGEALFKSVGCTACHSISGERKYGPSLDSIFGRDVVVIRNGTKQTVKVDREYILRSLKDPEFETVVSFPEGKMPHLDLSAEEIDHLVDYILFINRNSH